MCALGRLPCAAQGYASSEVDKRCARLTRARWPGLLGLQDVTKVDGKLIDQLAASIGYRVDFVLLTAGAPAKT